jgi:hypothetical protein
VAATTTYSASAPSSSQQQTQQRPNTMINSPHQPFALEHLVKMDRLNIQTPSEGDEAEEADEFEVLLRGDYGILISKMV